MTDLELEMAKVLAWCEVGIARYSTYERGFVASCLRCADIGGHHPACKLDAALTNAGLITAASREELRR